MNNIVALKHISKRFKNKQALNDVSLNIPEGCIVGLVGENGAGKTTLIRIMLGLARADEGEVELFGENFTIDSSDEQAKRIKDNVSVVLDSCPFPEDMSAEEVGRLMCRAYSAWDMQSFASWCDVFELARTTKVKELSRGMGMKLQLAVALSHDARLLVLDEATAGLDPLARVEVLSYLGEYMKAQGRAQGRGILLCSHITTDLERIADIVVGFHAGEVLFMCEKEAITDDAGVVRCALDDVENVLASCGFPGCIVLRDAYAARIMVPDRRAFAKMLPNMPCEGLSLDEFMQFQLKGERYE